MFTLTRSPELFEQHLPNMDSASPSKALTEPPEPKSLEKSRRKPKRSSRKRRRGRTVSAADAEDKPATAQVLHCWKEFTHCFAQCSIFLIGLGAIFAAGVYIFGNGVQEMDLKDAPVLRAIGVPEEEVAPLQRTFVQGLADVLRFTYDFTRLSLGLVVDVHNPIDISAIGEEEEQREALKRKEEETMQHRTDQVESQGKGPYGIYNMLERRRSKLATTLVHRWDQAAWAFD